MEGGRRGVERREIQLRRSQRIEKTEKEKTPWPKSNWPKSRNLVAWCASCELAARCDPPDTPIKFRESSQSGSHQSF